MRNEPRHNAGDRSHFVTFGSLLGGHFANPEADAATRIRVVASDAAVIGLLDQGPDLHTPGTKLLHGPLGHASGSATLHGIGQPRLAYRPKIRGVTDENADAAKPATLP